MRSLQALFAAVVASLSLGFCALLARAAYEGVVVGAVSAATVSLLFVTGFLIVSTVAVIASRGKVATWSTNHCHACGAPVYLTVRAFDRRRVRTCFTCGHEIVLA